MKVRLGYVALPLTIEGLTSSHTISYTNYTKNGQNDDQIRDLILMNLEALEQIIDYNIRNDIHFYRLSSNLIPLATHADTSFDYIIPYLDVYQRIGKKIKESGMRVDFHPDQFTVLNSTKAEVIQNTQSILEYHYQLLNALGVEKPLLILHVGSSVLGKQNAMTRFIHQFYRLPDHLQKIIAIENDDKTFTIVDTLELCEKLHRPMVLDVHHYHCNHGEEQLEDYWERIVKTWKDDIPKVHFSSPKSHLKKEFRSHHEYIDCHEFVAFIEIAKTYPGDFDVMIEAKQKDEALFRLVRQLKFQTDYLFLDGTSFQIH